MRGVCWYLAASAALFGMATVLASNHRNVTAQPPRARWKLVWSDEFDGDHIDKAKWDFDIGKAAKGWCEFTQAACSRPLLSASGFVV
jgi:beta-glucanase (GH16 family)